MTPCVPPYQKISGSKVSFTVGILASRLVSFEAVSSEPSPSESSSAACIVAVLTFFFFEVCFVPSTYFRLIWKFVAVSVVGGCKEDLAAFGYASQSVFGIVTVDGGFSFCFLFDQVSVIVVDVFDLISGLGVFLGNYLVILVIRYGDGSVLIGMSALIDLTETS